MENYKLTEILILLFPRWLKLIFHPPLVGVFMRALSDMCYSMH